MSRENPWAYHEARNRLREQERRERDQMEGVVEHFEKQRALSRVNRRLDIFELRRKIETGHSLDSLRKEISEALRGEIISRDTFDVLQASLDATELHRHREATSWEGSDIPFGNTALAQIYEQSPLWNNFRTDIAGFSYGFFVQGGAIMIILLWRILYDFLMLPRDVLEAWRSRSS